MSAINSLEESVLVLRCRVGDREALAELIDRYDRPLRYFISHVSDSPEMTQDVVQDTWIAVIGKLHALRRVESFRPWLYRIARNAAYQQLRRKKKSCEFRDDLELPDDGPADDLPPLDAARVHSALKRLSPAHREVLALRFMEEMTYDEVAGVLDCGLNTVKSRIHYAKLALRKELEEDHGQK